MISDNLSVFEPSTAKTVPTECKGKKIIGDTNSVEPQNAIFSIPKARWHG